MTRFFFLALSLLIASISFADPSHDEQPVPPPVQSDGSTVPAPKLDKKFLDGFAAPWVLPVQPTTTPPGVVPRGWGQPVVSESRSSGPVVSESRTPQQPAVKQWIVKSEEVPPSVKMEEKLAGISQDIVMLEMSTTNCGPCIKLQHHIEGWDGKRADGSQAYDNDGKPIAPYEGISKDHPRVKFLGSLVRAGDPVPTFKGKKLSPDEYPVVALFKRVNGEWKLLWNGSGEIPAVDSWIARAEGN